MLRPETLSVFAKPMRGILDAKMLSSILREACYSSLSFYRGESLCFLLCLGLVALGALMSSVNVLPTPLALFTLMVPRIAWASLILTWRPRPWPLGFRFLLARVLMVWNLENSSGMCSFSMPMPLSITLMVMLLRGNLLTMLACRYTVLFSFENLTAFVIKLTSTYCRRCGSSMK